LTRAEAKLRARRAYGRVLAAGSLSSVVVDRLWSDTLMAVEHQPAATESYWSLLSSSFRSRSRSATCKAWVVSKMLTGRTPPGCRARPVQAVQ
jgi:hypothetical protein